MTLRKAEQLGLIFAKPKKASKPKAVKQERQPVQHPGVRGGVGYYDAHGVWHYGMPEGTTAPVEQPLASPPPTVEPAATPPVAAVPPPSPPIIAGVPADAYVMHVPEEPPASELVPPHPPEPPVIEPPAPEPEPEKPAKRTYDVEGKSIPEGYYAVPSRTGKNDLDFYEVDVGREGGKWAGIRFVGRIVGGAEASLKIDRRQQADALVRIQHYGIDESRARFGQAMGRCGKCGRTLTDAVSRAIGIGPECRKGMGEELRKILVPPVDPNMPDKPALADIPMPESDAPTVEEVTGVPETPAEPEAPAVVEAETALDALRDELKIRQMKLAETTTQRGRPALAMTGNTYAHNTIFQKIKAAGLIWGTKLPGGQFAWCTFEDRVPQILGYFNAERARRISERDTGPGSGDGGAGGVRPEVREPSGVEGGEAGVGAGGIQGGAPSQHGGMVHGGYTQEALKRMTNEELAVVGPPEPKSPLALVQHPVLAALDPVQQTDVRLITDAWNRGESGFLLGNSTGTGKTVVGLGTILQLGTPRSLVVVPNQTIVDQWVGDAKKIFGMTVHGRMPETATEPGVFVTTYAMLRQKDRPLHGDFGLLIPDEIHMQGMKLTQGKKTAQMMADISQRSKMTIYSTASPYESPAQLYYLRELKLWPQFRKGAWRTWAQDHGIRFIEKKVGRDKWVTVPQWHGSRESKLHDMLRIRAAIIGNGKGVARELVVDQPLNSDFRAVESHHGEYGATVQRAMRAMEDLSSAAIKVNIQKRLLDYVKLDAASDAAVDAVRAGQHVVMMVSNKSPFRFSDPVDEEDDELPSRIRQEVIDRFARAGLTGELPSPTELLRQKVAAKLGEHSVATFTGDVTQGKRAKLKAAFNEGKLPVLISTIAAGGTGLSLHDTVGNAPRTQINVGLPWTGRDFMQMLGRTYRRGTASPVQQVFFWTSHPREQAIAETVAGRLAAGRAGVQGITAETNAAKLAEFAIRGSDIEDDIRDDDRDLAAKSRAWLDQFFNG